jgi:hypothetical protein
MAQFKSRKYALPKPSRIDGSAVYINDQVAVSAALTVADTIDFVLPKGTELSKLRFYFTPLAASALAGSIGFTLLNGATAVMANGASVAANTSYFRAAGTFGLTAGGFLCDFIPITFEDDVKITITITVAGVTPTAGTAYCIMGGNQIGVM